MASRGRGEIEGRGGGAARGGGDVRAERMVPSGAPQEQRIQRRRQWPPPPQASPSPPQQQVHNEQPTLSLNHNWLAGPAAVGFARFLLSELSAARDAIRHLRATVDNRRESRRESRRDDALDEAAWQRQCLAIMGANCGVEIAEARATLVH